MENNELDLKKGNFYSKKEIEENGLVYIKETTITMFYRKEDLVFIFDAKPNKCMKHKFLTYDED
jgi:hypothetical protein